MKFSGMLFGCCLVLMGCGGGRNGFVASSSARKGTMTFHEAGEASYRFAVSGQVLDDNTRNPVPQFSLSVLGNDPALTSVLNGLGQANGIFHLSRNPSLRDDLFAQLPVILSAPGFEPSIQTLEIGSDCKNEPCAETRPLRLWLKQRALPVVESLAFPALPQVTQLIEQKGIGPLFKAMTTSGKVDALITSELARSNNRDLLSNVLVVLKPASSGSAPDAVAKLLGSVPSDLLKGLSSANSGMVSSLVPLLSSANPKFAAQLLGLNGALNYLGPILGAVSDKESGQLGQVVAGLLKSEDPSKTWTMLSQSLAGQTRQPQLAMPFFSLPGLDSGEGVGALGNQTFSNVVQTALRNPSLLNFISSLGRSNGAGSSEQKLLLEFTQPLLQGLVSKNAAEIATLFNSLLQQNGLMAIKDFASQPNKEKFVKLFPYIEPLIRGLNSQDSPHLAAALLPFLDQKNPALALRELLTKGSGSLTTKGQVAASLFPALPLILSQAVPAKQIFSAQLLSGLVTGDLGDVKVIQDLPGMAGLILSGQARDIFKIAQLPNVERVMALPVPVK